MAPASWTNRHGLMMSVDWGKAEDICSQRVFFDPKRTLPQSDCLIILGLAGGWGGSCGTVAGWLICADVNGTVGISVAGTRLRKEIRRVRAKQGMRCRD